MNSNYSVSNIKYIRKKKNLSQAKLGEMIGVSQPTINRWENKSDSPTIDNLLKFCDVFNIWLGDLVCKDLSVENNEYDKQIEQLSTDNGIKIIIDKNAPLTAENVLEVQKVLSEVLEEQNKKDTQKH